MNASTLWLALGWTMLHSLLCGLALGVLVALGRVALWRARPAVRYGFLCASLAMLAGLPVALFAIAPRASIGGVSATPDVLFGLMSASPRSWTQELIQWLPWVWTIGTSLYVVLLLRGLAQTSSLKRRAGAALERRELSARCDALARELGVARRVLVRFCDEVASPLVVGIVRPLIVLPSAILARCSPEQIEMVLLHELAHVRRWDNLVQLVQRVVQATLFWQPAVWLVSGWIDLEREHCCDAVVLARTQRPRAYAQTLLALADAQQGAPALTLSMAKRPLLARLERILRTQEPIGMHAKTTALALTAALLVGGTLLAPWNLAQASTQRGFAPRALRAPHPTGLPPGTDCAACHTTPVSGPSPHVAVPGDELEGLRAQERELQLLLLEVQRLRQQLAVLRGDAVHEREAQAPALPRGMRRSESPPQMQGSPRIRARVVPGTPWPGAAPAPEAAPAPDAAAPRARGRLRSVPGVPRPGAMPAPAPPAAPDASLPRLRLRSRNNAQPPVEPSTPLPRFQLGPARQLFTPAPGQPSAPAPAPAPEERARAGVPLFGAPVQPPAAPAPQGTPAPVQGVPLVGALFPPSTPPVAAPPVHFDPLMLGHPFAQPERGAPSASPPFLSDLPVLSRLFRRAEPPASEPAHGPH